MAYEFTVTDPTVYTAPYTAMMPFRRTDGPLFEYACHEGNIGLHGILAGARNSREAGSEAATLVRRCPERRLYRSNQRDLAVCEVATHVVHVGLPPR